MTNSAARHLQHAQALHAFGAVAIPTDQRCGRAPGHHFIVFYRKRMQGVACSGVRCAQHFSFDADAVVGVHAPRPPLPHHARRQVPHQPPFFTGKAAVQRRHHGVQSHATTAALCGVWAARCRASNRCHWQSPACRQSAYCCHGYLATCAPTLCPIQYSGTPGMCWRWCCATAAQSAAQSSKFARACFNGPCKDSAWPR